MGGLREFIRNLLEPKSGGTTSFTFTPGMGTTEQVLISENSINNVWKKMIGCRLNLKGLEDDTNTPNLTIKRYLRDNQDTDEEAESGLWTNGTSPTIVEISDCWYDRVYEIRGTLSAPVDANATIYIDYGIIQKG